MQTGPHHLNNHLQKEKTDSCSMFDHYGLTYVCMYPNSRISKLIRRIHKLKSKIFSLNTQKGENLKKSTIQILAVLNCPYFCFIACTVAGR